MKKGFSKKDVFIVILSVMCLLLLIGIIYSSHRNNKMISEMLENDSQLVASNVTETEKVFTDYVSFSEASSEKWIELYNSGSDQIDISGVTVYLAGEKIGTVEEGTILAKDSYVAIDLNKNPGEASVNIISLKDKDGNDIAGYFLPQILSGKSYGLAAADSNVMGYMEPTKGKANDYSSLEYVSYDGIKFSTPTGFYSGSFYLTLEAGEGEKIYYTTDGTVPTTKSQEYVDPINIKKPSSSDAVYSKTAFDYYKSSNYMGGSIDRAMVVNAIKVNGSGKITGKASQIYFLDMAKDVSYKNIPIISITLNPDDLIGYEDGIYVSGKGYDDALVSGEKSPSNFSNYLSGMKKDCMVTYIEPTKGISMETDGQVGIYYNSEVSTAQKAFRITLDDSIWKFTGSSLLDYIDGDYELIVAQNLDDETLKLREYIANDLISGSAVGTYEMTPVVVFVEGEYWGLYMLKAPYDPKYFSKNYGVKEDNLNIRKYYSGVYSRTFKEVTDFIINNDMSVSENYRQVQQMMDIDSYLTFVCANVYIGNTSFSTTGTSTWKTNDSNGKAYSDGKWRWLMDFTADSMNSSRKQNFKINTFMTPGVRGDRVFQSLLMNKDFCKRMVQIMEGLATNNFNEEKCSETIDNYVALIKKPAMDSYSRFNGSLSDSVYTAQVEDIREFFDNRAEYIMEYTRELAEKGGDLEYVAQVEAEAAKKKGAASAEASNGASNEATEGDSAEGTENGEGTGGAGEAVAPAENVENEGNGNG